MEEQANKSIRNYTFEVWDLVILYLQSYRQTIIQWRTFIVLQCLGSIAYGLDFPLHSKSIRFFTLPSWGNIMEQTGPIQSLHNRFYCRGLPNLKGLLLQCKYKNEQKIYCMRIWKKVILNIDGYKWSHIDCARQSWLSNRELFFIAYSSSSITKYSTPNYYLCFSMFVLVV